MRRTTAAKAGLATMFMSGSLALGALVLVVPAAATTPAPVAAPARLVPQPLQVDRTGGLGNRIRLKSLNWAGWGAGTGKFTDVTASWVEPSVSCPTANATVAIWAGIDGLNDNSVEQAGTIAECNGAAAKHFVWWEMFPTNAVQVVAQISAGDHISTSTSFAAGKFTMSVTDSTHPADSFTTIQSCGAGVTCNRASAEWIVEAPSSGSSILPLADFASVTLSNAAAATKGADQPVNTPAFHSKQLLMVASNHKTHLATASNLTANGSTFSVTWDQAQ